MASAHRDRPGGVAPPGPGRPTGTLLPTGTGPDGSVLTIETALGLVAVCALIAANALFVAVEFGLVASDRNRLRQLEADGVRGARAACSAVSHLSFTLSGAQLGISLVSLTIGFLVEPALSPLFATVLQPIGSEAVRRGISAVLALTLATVAQMVFGELIPKGLAIAAPERTTTALAGVVRTFTLACAPLIRALNATANWLVRRLGVEPREELSQVRTLPEMAALFRTSAAEGTIAEPASRLLARSVAFGDKTAADALVPRVEMRAVPADGTIDDLVEIVLATGFSRLPVTGADLDDVVGVVHAKAVHGVPPAERATTPVRAVMTDAPTVPESRQLADVLRDMRVHHQHLVIVVDEYGGTAGILTLEDVVEEIVGDIADEHDPGARVSWTVAPGEHVVPASLHADEVEEATGFRMPDGEYETIAGLVLERLGHIPDPGEAVTVDGWRVEVLDTERRRIVTVRVSAPAASDGPAGSASADGDGPGGRR